jgi:hypothetical protein
MFDSCCQTVIYNSANIINLRMFLGDPLSIETHLNNDWSMLLRNLKSKEDHLFELLHYNH